MSFPHEKSEERGVDILANIYVTHKLVGINVGVSGATCWSHWKTEQYVVLLGMKWNSLYLSQLRIPAGWLNVEIG